MSVIFIVFPIAMVIVAAAIVAFIWAMRSGQFEDLETPGLRMLHEEEATEPTAAPGRTPSGVEQVSDEATKEVGSGDCP